MTDYTKIYDGAALDTAKETIAGADFDVEFDAIEVAVATKADKVSGHTTNSIGLVDVNGNLLSSEVLIDTDGTLAGDSDSSVPTEKAVKTYVDAVIAGSGRLVMLDTPELIAGGALTKSAWTTINNTTLGTAGAKAALCRLVVGMTSSGTATVLTSTLWTRKAGTALAVDDLTESASQREQTSSAANLTLSLTSSFTVKLDSSSDFDYYYSNTAAVTVDLAKIILIGYYV